MHAIQAAAGAGGVVEKAEAAPQHGAMQELVGKAKTWRKKFPLGLYSNVPVGVKVRNHHLASLVVQIHHAIGNFNWWRQELVAEADIDRQPAGHPKVVCDISPDLQHTVACPNQLEVLR